MHCACVVQASASVEHVQTLRGDDHGRGEREHGAKPAGHGPPSSARFDAGTDVPGIGPDERRVATTPSRHKILIEKLRLHLRANCPLMAIKHDSADRPGSLRRRSFRGD